MFVSDSDRSWRGLRGGESSDMAGFGCRRVVHPRSATILLFNAPKFVRLFEMEKERWDRWGLDKIPAMMLVSPR